MSKTRLRDQIAARGERLDHVEDKSANLVSIADAFLQRARTLADKKAEIEREITAATNPKTTPRTKTSSRSISEKLTVSDEHKTTADQSTTKSTSSEPDPIVLELTRLFAEKTRLTLENLNNEKLTLDDAVHETGNNIAIKEIINRIDAIKASKNEEAISLLIATLAAAEEVNIRQATVAKQDFADAGKAVDEIIGKTTVGVAASKSYVEVFYETEKLVQAAKSAPKNEDTTQTKAREQQIKENLQLLRRYQNTVIENLMKSADKTVTQSESLPHSVVVATPTSQSPIKHRNAKFFGSVALTLAGIAMLAALVSNPAGWVLGIMIAVGTVLLASGVVGMTLSSRSKKTSRVAPSDGASPDESPAGSSHADKRKGIVTVTSAPRPTASFAAKRRPLSAHGQYKPAEMASDSSKRATGLNRRARQQRPSM